MEIRFIWIAEYREIIENLNVNFHHSGRHSFNYHDGVLELIDNKIGPLSFGEKIKVLQLSLEKTEVEKVVFVKSF